MYRKLIILLVLVAVVALLAINSILAKEPVIEQEMVIWEISKAKVVDPGSTVDMAEGQFFTGYTIEAKVKAKNNNVVPEGDFRLTLDAFSPYEDMGKQKAGRWYVQGHWTITKKNADEKELKVKHNPNKAEGTLVAELTDIPMTKKGNWTGKAILPMVLAAGRWSRGDGTLTFGPNLDGDLFLQLDRWPEAK
ncbi:MAG: hypothetical protein ACK2UR_13405 [Candidatus Promineifilaceae bacterium]